MIPYWILFQPFINRFLGFQNAQSWPPNPKDNISTTTGTITTINTQRYSHCASDDKKYNAILFQTPKIHHSAWRKSRSEDWNRNFNHSWTAKQLWSSFFLESTARVLSIIRNKHSKTFQVTIVMQWAKPRPQDTLVNQTSAKSIRWTTSNGRSGIISCPIFTNKAYTLRLWRDLFKNFYL